MNKEEEEEGVDRAQTSKILNKVKSVENINKNHESFLEINTMQKKGLVYRNCKTMNMSNKTQSDHRKIYSLNGIKHEKTSPGQPIK